MTPAKRTSKRTPATVETKSSARARVTKAADNSETKSIRRSSAAKTSKRTSAILDAKSTSTARTTKPPTTRSAKSIPDASAAKAPKRTSSTVAPKSNGPARTRQPTNCVAKTTPLASAAKILPQATPHAKSILPPPVATNLRAVDQSPGESHLSAVDGSLELLIATEYLNDIEGLRIAQENRLRSAKAEAPNLDLSSYEKMGEAFARIEMAAVKQVELAVQWHPLGFWVSQTKGIGYKQGGRLIGSIGKVSVKGAQYKDGVLIEAERPRRDEAELWAYCGYVPGQKRKKGVKSNWNAKAKMRAYLCAEAAVKAGVRKLVGCNDDDGYDLTHRKAISPLGAEYLSARAHYSDAVHKDPCPQCGPAGKPALAGSPLSNGHKHARALRIVAKEILRDMFLEARGLGV